MKLFISFVLSISFIVGLGYIFFLSIHLIPANWVPFVGAGFGFLVSRIYESYKENKSRLYEKKREVYGKLLQPYINVLIDSGNNKDKQQITITPEMYASVISAGFDTILYASDDVVKSYSKFRTASVSGEIGPNNIMVNLSALLKAMRKDLGHQFTSLSDFEILSVFINFTPEQKERFFNLNKHSK